MTKSYPKNLGAVGTHPPDCPFFLPFETVVAMQLKDLYPNFTEQSEFQQRQMVASYRTRRAKDFTWIREQNAKKPAKKKKAPAVQLSPEEKILMKKMGLTVAQLNALKAMQT